MKKQNTITITKITDKDLLKMVMQEAKSNLIKYDCRDFIIWNNESIYDNIEYSYDCNDLIKEICRKFAINLKTNNMHLNVSKFKSDVINIFKSLNSTLEQPEENKRNFKQIVDILSTNSNIIYTDLSTISRIINILSNEKFKNIIIPDTKSDEERFLIIRDDNNLIYREIELMINVFTGTVSVYNVEFNNRDTEFIKSFSFYSSYDYSDVEDSMNVMVELTQILQKVYNISIDDIINSQIIIETEV